MRRLAGWAMGALVLGLGSATQAADEPKLSDYYGFLPVEIYKLEYRIGSPRIADFDGDGSGDVLIVNNGRSRIDLLLTSKGPDRKGAPAVKPEVNELPDDKRMRRVSVPMSKEVVAVQVGEFNGDSKPDIAFYGKPAELIVMFNQGDGKFETARRLETPDATDSPSGLDSADLNKDGRADLALMRTNEVLIFTQGPEGRFEVPEKLPHTATNPSIIKLADLDGDGGIDLILVGQDRDAPLRVRFAGPKGTLGPEQRFPLDRIRAIDFAEIDGKPGSELLMIDDLTGRAQVMKLKTGELDDAESRGRLIYYPLPEGTTRDRDLDLGDLDGDGKPDVVVSDPANTQLLVQLQSANAGSGGLSPASTYPSLIGAKAVRLADLDGDKKAEVYVLSSREKQIGTTRLVDDRLPFPSPSKTVGEPLAMEVVGQTLVYVTRDEGKVVLRALAVKDGELAPAKLGDQESIEVKGAASAKAMKALDVNRDGQLDLLIFNESGPPALLLGREGKAPEVFTGALGPLSAATDVGVFPTQLKADTAALLVAQGAIARDVRMEEDRSWKVLDQFNAGRSGAQIQGVASLDVDMDGKREIVLWDRASKKLLILADREGVYRNTGSIDLGTIDIVKIRAADLNGDGHEDLFLAGGDKYGVVLTGKTGLKFQTIASYETERKNARFDDLGTGDLNGDGQPDVMITDVVEHFLEIVAFEKRTDLVRALAFPVFEKKSFRGIDDLVEPRGFAIGDVDGDRRQDIVLIVHDRVLIYRQDSGEPVAATAAQANNR